MLGFQSNHGSGAEDLALLAEYMDLGIIWGPGNQHPLEIGLTYAALSNHYSNTEIVTAISTEGEETEAQRG